MSGKHLACFMAYDVRGRVPEDLNVDMVYDIGRAYVAEMKPEGPVVIGHDIRDSSEAISSAIIRGINDAGVDTVDIGLCGTEMVYYGSSLDGMGGGIMVTASHNPKGYNGLKFVRSDARPISADTGLMDIERRVITADIPPVAAQKGAASERDVTEGYVRKILSFIHPEKMKPLKILVNPGNGCAGPTFDAITATLPFEVVRMNFEPDGKFPSGIPNPLLIENRAKTAKAVTSSGAVMGVAWDGDFDRCFFFDETGMFIEGYYLVGFLAKRLLAANPGGKIVHDPRLVWNTFDIVEEAGGTAVVSKSGHSFMKEKMRETGSIYGGEMSAHHYFRDFSYSDSGMIPWLLIAEELSISGLKLSDLVRKRISMFPCSGEINRTVADAASALKNVEKRFVGKSTAISHLDGVTLEFGDAWRFNLRMSNTEPVIRLNVESSGNKELLNQKTAEILECLGD